MEIRYNDEVLSSYVCVVVKWWWWLAGLEIWAGVCVICCCYNEDSWWIQSTWIKHQSTAAATQNISVLTHRLSNQHHIIVITNSQQFTTETRLWKQFIHHHITITLVQSAQTAKCYLASAILRDIHRQWWYDMNK